MEVYLKDEKVNVNVIRKNNKNIYFRFDEHLNLVVSASKRVSLSEINKLIKKNEASLYRLYLKSKKRMVNESEFWYLGNKYDLVSVSSKDVVIKDNKIYYGSSDILNKFIKNKTKEIFMEEVNNLKKIIKTPEFSLKIRKMKTRWGVCNYKRMTITLNSELIKYKKDLLRYVIVHEMCHFYHHDHSPNFWHLMGEYYPNYKEARKELRS